MTEQVSRIKLAEAMGWIKGPDGFWDNGILGDVRPDPPNPFLDANDDYDVLEWVRNQVVTDHGTLPASGKPRWSSSDKWWPFYEQFGNVTAASYKIGDYARAIQLIFILRSRPCMTMRRQGRCS